MDLPADPDTIARKDWAIYTWTTHPTCWGRLAEVMERRFQLWSSFDLQRSQTISSLGNLVERDSGIAFDQHLRALPGGFNDDFKHLIGVVLVAEVNWRTFRQKW